MAVSLDTWRCNSCTRDFRPDEPQHRVWYEQGEAGEITPHDALGIPGRVRELLRDLKRGAPLAKATVGPEYYCDVCYWQRFPHEQP